MALPMGNYSLTHSAVRAGGRYTLAGSAAPADPATDNANVYNMAFVSAAKTGTGKFRFVMHDRYKFYGFQTAAANLMSDADKEVHVEEVAASSTGSWYIDLQVRTYGGTAAFATGTVTFDVEFIQYASNA